MAEERIGRVSVGVDPEFDQAELFRQIKLATKKIPALQLKPKLSAKDVNAEIRKLNAKKLTAVKIPVKFVVDRKALKELGMAEAKAIKSSKASTVKAQDDIEKARVRLWERSAATQSDIEVATDKNLKELWKNLEKSYALSQRSRTIIAQKEEKERTRIQNAAITQRKVQIKFDLKALKDTETAQRKLVDAEMAKFKAFVKERTRIQNAAVTQRKVQIKFEQKSVDDLLKVQNKVIERIIKEGIERKRATQIARQFNKEQVQEFFDREKIWKAAEKRRSTIDKDNKALQKLNRTVTNGVTGIRQFAANIIVLRSAFSLIRVTAIATAIGFLAQAVATAATAVTVLSSAIAVGLVGALTAATSGALAFAQANLVIKLSVEGVKQALGGLNEEIDQKKFLALTSAAQSFVLVLDGMKPAIRGFQQSLQQELFSRLIVALQTITPLMGQFAVPLQQTARTLGDLAIAAANVGAAMSGDLVRVLSTNNILIENMGMSAINLAHALVDILVAAGPFVVFLSNTTREMSRAVRQFIQAKRESGELATFFEHAADALSNLGSIAKSLGTVVVNIFRAALPFGDALLEQIASVSADLADITGSKKGQKGLTEFFKAAMPAIREVGGLIVDIGEAFIELSHQEGFLILIKAIRKDLLPVLVEVIGKLTGEFGPTLIHTIANLAVLFGNIAGELGPLRAVVEVVGAMAALFNAIIETRIGKAILAVASAIFVLEAALAVLAVQRYLFAASGLKFVLMALGRVVVFSLVPALGALRLALLSVSSAMLAILVNPLTIAIAGLAGAFYLAWNNSELFRKGTTKFSDAVLDAIPGLRAAAEASADWVLQLQGISQEAVIATAGISSIESAAKRLAATQMGLSTIGKGKGGKGFFDLYTNKRNKMSAAERQIADARKEAEKYYQMINNIGVPAEDALKEATKSTNEVMKERMQGTVDVMREKLDKLSGSLEKQKGIVDGLKSALEDLKNVQLEGTKAFSDAKFALDQQTKSLELQQVELKLAGATDEDPRLAALQVQLDSLNLQAQKVDLTESLQLDPLRRKFDETINPIKELSFTSAIAEFQKLTAEHEAETKTLDKVQKKYDGLNEAIKKVEKSISRIADSTGSLTSGLSAAVSAPSVIAEPLDAANKSLTSSNEKIQKNVGTIREGLRKPFRLGARDINNILMNLPSTANAGALAFITWANETGWIAGRRMMQGFMQGIKSYLVEGSNLHKLLNEEIPAFIRANKGPIAADRQILVPAGVAIMEGLTTGLRRGFDPVKGYLKEVGPSMEEYVPDSMFAKRTAEFMVEVAAGKKPDPNKFFGDLAPDPISITGGIADPRLGFLHKTMSLADTGQMAASLAKTFGLSVTSLFRPGAITSSGNLSDHGFGLAADLSNGSHPTPQMDALSNALRPLFGTIIKQLIYRDKDQNKGYPIPNHMNHVHVAFLPDKEFSLNSGRIGKSALKGSPFAAIFAAAAQRFGIPAALLQAVTKAESGFDPRAGSGAGAQGLMQLLPSTFAAQHVGGNIFDPKQNIFAGAKYLSEQLKKFKSIRLALAAYNAGPGAVGSYGGVPPFSETIAYIARVMDFLKDFGGFRMHGGPTMPGRSYMVGEGGPEFFTPSRPGHIVSNDRLDRMIKAMESANRGGTTSAPTYNVHTNLQNPSSVVELIEAKARRRRARIDL